MIDKELKKLFASLAVAQKETKGPFKKTGRQFKEIGRRFKETDRQFKETDRRSKETDRRIEKLTADLDKFADSFADSLEKEKQERERARKESELEMKQLRKEFSGLGISIGESAEECFYRYFKSHPQLGPWTFNQVERNLKPYHREYDLVLVNGEVVVLVSIKHRLREKSILHLRDQEIPAFRQDYPVYANHSIYGALGAMVISQDSERVAQKNGFFVFGQSGDCVEILNLEATRPKAY